MGHSEYDPAFAERRPWNAAWKPGAKRAFKPQQVWAIRFYLDRERRLRDRALFDLAIDSKLRGCDVVKVRIGDLVSGARVRSRAIVIQQKTGRPVQFELLEPARTSILAWLERRSGSRRLRFPEPNRPHPIHEHSTVCPACRRVGHWHRLAAGGLRYTLPSPNEGVDHLQGNRQSARCTDPPRAYKNRKHRPLPRGQCRRRAHLGRGH
jgi:hypothetical protein